MREGFHPERSQKEQPMPRNTLVVTRLPKEVESRVSRDYVARFNRNRLYSSDELKFRRERTPPHHATGRNRRTGAFPFTRLCTGDRDVYRGFDHIDLAAAAACTSGIQGDEHPGCGDRRDGGYRDSSSAGCFSACD